MAWTIMGEKPFSTQYITLNPYYNLPTIKITNLVLHSVGVGSSRTTQQWRDRWDRKDARNSVSAVVGPIEGIVMLQSFEKSGYGKKCAGVGKGSKGSYNACSLQVEMQEYKGIKYTGGANFTVTNRPECVKYQLDTLDTAIQFLANAALFHNLDVTKPGVLVSHHEAHLLGYAGNHGDCDHLFNQLPEMNMSMDKVRKLVAERVEQYRIEKEFEDMTQPEFDKFLLNASPEVIDKIIDAYMNRKAKITTPANWAKDAMEWAKNNGIVFGGDKSSSLMPFGITDRQTALVFLKRYNDNVVNNK